MTAPTTPLSRAARTSARLALWLSLTICSASALLLARWARPLPVHEIAAVQRDQQRWVGVDFAARPEVRLLRDLVAIDTSHPHPDEVAAAEYLAARLAAAGVTPTVERLGDRRANLWAVIEGDDSRALVLHGHLDVEPLLDEGEWRHPPLSGAIEGPWIYGRGMYDMKSLLAAQLEAFVEVARSGRRPRRSLLLLATSSEETGSVTGTRWILAQHPELVARMGTVLTEGGVVEATAPGQIKFWGIEFGQKRFARFEACSSRRADLAALARQLRLDPGADPRPDVDPAIRAFLAAYGPTRDLSLYRDLTADLDRLTRDATRFDRLTPFLKALLRDEVAPLRLEPDPGGGWRLPLSLQLLPQSDVEGTLARLLPSWRTHGLTLTAPELTGTRDVSPIDHSDFRTVAGVILHHHPGAPVGPYFLPWTATDARYYRAAGLVAYGVSPFALVASEAAAIGKPNERMQLPAFSDGVALYRDLVRALVD